MLRDGLLLTILLLLTLSGCGDRNLSKKLLSNVTDEVNKHHNIKHGEVVPKYDLAGKANMCIHAPHYALIINDTKHNKAYINKATSKSHSVETLQSKASAKLASLKDKLKQINAKYKVFSNSEVRAIKSVDDGTSAQPSANSPFDIVDHGRSVRKKNINYLEKLNKLDKLFGHVPIFFPQYASSLTSKFGMRKHPVHKVDKFHYGTDFAGKRGSIIYSAAYGKVSVVGRQSGYGNIVEIDHGKGFVTRYAHLSKIFVNEGEKIIRGQKIGMQGASGNAASDHLHFEVIFQKNRVDPMDFVDTGYKCQKQH